jgi:putative drug exporter of the RND superfamily
MSAVLYRLGRLCASRPIVTIVAWLVGAAAVLAFGNVAGQELEDSFGAPGLDSTRAVELLEARSSQAAGLTALVVASPSEPNRSFFESRVALDSLRRLEQRLAELDNVIAVARPSEVVVAGSNVATQSGLVSSDGRVALIRLQYPVVEDLSTADLTSLHAVGDDRGAFPELTVDMSGDLFFAFEQPESQLSELIGLAAAVVVLLVAFGSVIAMGLPIGLALFGLAVSVSLMPLVAHLIDIPTWAPQVASMVGLGVGIDYALLLVTRHREFLADGMTVREAAARATATAGQAVLFAGATVVIAILGLLIAGIPFMTAAGVAISVTVLLMVTASLTLLPAFLGLAGHRINRFGLPHRHRSSSAKSASQTAGRWDRWGAHVANHSWPYMLGVTAALLALTAPVLSIRLGFPDEGSLPTSRTERRAYERIAAGFGPGINGPMVVAIDTSSDPSVAEPLRAAIVADPGIASVSPVAFNENKTLATLFVVPRSAPQEPATMRTIARLRNEAFPGVIGDRSARAHIGGQTALFGDLGERVEQRLPWFIGAVVLLSVLMLMMVFRSVLVPIKAALMNLLSIGSAYGVLVMVFQWGWGKDLIGLEHTIPVVAFIPMFMFAILFGLSMDYEVFLLSRVREEYLLTGDSDTAVLHGIARTARVITSAALIMISVFMGFVLSDDPTTKMMGLGLATAILVDATIIRMVLVPASMKLLGSANWWLPGWLDRLLPNVDIEGETRLPEPERELAAVV